MGKLCFVVIIFLFSAAALAAPPWPMQPFKGGAAGGFHATVPVGAGANVFSSSGGITLNSDHNGSVVFMTALGEVSFPDCSASSIGYFATICVRDASEQVELVMGGDISSDIFVLKSGTELDANDEANMPTAGKECATIMCLEINKWYIIANDSPCTDGGTAD